MSAIDHLQIVYELPGSRDLLLLHQLQGEGEHRHHIEGGETFFFEVGQPSITSISVADVTQQVRENITRGRGEYLRVKKRFPVK